MKAPYFSQHLSGLYNKNSSDCLSKTLCIMYLSFDCEAIVASVLVIPKAELALPSQLPGSISFSIPSTAVHTADCTIQLRAYFVRTAHMHAPIKSAGN